MAERGTLVSGSFAAASSSATFVPIVDKPFNLNLISSSFVGTIKLRRSFDAGVTWNDLTANGAAILALTAAASESWTESETGVVYKLECTAFTSGSMAYRLSQ